MVTITFLGATETVTGSRYLVESKQSRILVDCGLFQGWKKLRRRNWAAPPISPEQLDAVIFTHAHIDHTGYFPKLCALGYSKRAYCTPATRDLMTILLPDSGFLQEQEAMQAKRDGRSRHIPPLPLYTRDDALRSLEQLDVRHYGRTFEPAAGITAGFARAGHILGSASVTLTVEKRTITFTGDIGRPHDPIMRPPQRLGPTDYLITESTYGDRRHPTENIANLVEQVICDTVDRGGTVVVPAFAVGRAQHLLSIVAHLKAAGRIPDIPTYLDSPMAVNATKIFCRHRHREMHLNEDACRAMCNVATYTRSVEESKQIDQQTGPQIVISASGMATGGRILHHLRRFLPEERNSVVLVGYQASGSRGRLLADGCDELKIFGDYIPVRARIVQLHGLSAHADYREICDWFDAAQLSPLGVFVTHGEPGASDALRRRLHDQFGWKVVVPNDGSRWRLDLR